jgi:hypothetical protein
MEPQIELMPLLNGAVAEREAFLAGMPLAACDWPRALAAILPSHPQFNARPQPGGEKSYVLKVAAAASELWFRLPAAMDYRSLKIIATVPVITFEIETSLRTVRTNMQELMQTMAPWLDQGEPERLAAFAALCNAFEAPKPRPILRPFNSRILGQVVPDQYELWRAPPIKLPYLDGVSLPVLMSNVEPADVARIDQALENFLALGLDARDAASPRILAQCQEFLGLVGLDDDEDKEMAAITDPRKIWKHVAGEEILVERNDAGAEPAIYIALLCSCAWETEHGLQLVYRNGETLTRVSEQDGNVV